MTKKVCVIGAGAAGLCAARHFAGDSTFVVQVFEQSADIGGTWVYNDKIGNDQNGFPIHSSMYRNLRTNLPAKIMNFPDFMRMNAEEPCCVTHEEVRSYLQSYAEHFNLRKHIQFNTRVENVQYRFDELTGSDKWDVKVKNTKVNVEAQHTFDGIMICNGHYFDPYLPSIPGIESFPGKILHSHSYRKPEDFAGKTVLILGAGSSGIDIGIDLAAHVSQVYLSHNNARLNTILPSNMIEVQGVEKIEGTKFMLRDQTTVTAEVFLFCTGYNYSFPFLEENCGIHVDENYVTPLYKHMINIDHPTMCIIGIPATVVPFPLFHMQVKYFLALLKNAAGLPSKSVMLEDSKLKAARKKHGHKLMDKQWEYNDSLAIAGEFEPLPRFYKIGYEWWHASRKSNLLRYKDSKFLISADGTNVEVVIPDT